jgi:metal-responsive CopG/Arc/MetJ family transcriptional regulator
MEKYNKTTSVRIKPEILTMLNKLVKKGFNRSFIINEALRKYLLRNEFDSLRERMLPIAKEKGIFTDEDVEQRLS